MNGEQEWTGGPAYLVDGKIVDEGAALHIEATIYERRADAAMAAAHASAVDGDPQGAHRALRAAAADYEGAALLLDRTHNTYRAMTLRRRARWADEDAAAYAARFA